MTAIDRTKLLEALVELGRRYPDWRFGQLVANVADWADAGIWDVTDDQLLAAAAMHSKATNSTSQTVPSAAGR